MKYVQTHVFKGNVCVLQVFLCALISRPVCTRTRTQLRGNIAYKSTAAGNMVVPTTILVKGGGGLLIHSLSLLWHCVW